MVAKFNSIGVNEAHRSGLVLINIPRSGGVNRGGFRLIAIGVVNDAKYRGHFGHPSLKKPVDLPIDYRQRVRDFSTSFGSIV